MAKGGLGVTARVSSHAGAAGYLVRAAPKLLADAIMNGKSRTTLIGVKIMGRPGSTPAAVHLEELVC